MSADDRLEGRLQDALTAWLDSAAGPHPRWRGSPAELAVGTTGGRSRRQPAAWLLVAAIVVTAALVAAVAGALIAGGRLDAERPSPPAPPALVFGQPTMTPAPRSDMPTSTGEPPSGASEPTCRRDWAWTGTVSPVGLTDGVRIDDLDASEGNVVMIFGHPLDTVRRIRIEPATAPFGTGPAAAIKVAGVEHYRLSITGLNRPTQSVRDSIRAGVPAMPFQRTVGSPIAEMRRIVTPKVSFPVNGPGAHSTETWIIGLDRPTCLEVTTLRDTGFGGGEEPGHNAVVIHFPAAP